MYVLHGHCHSGQQGSVLVWIGVPSRLHCGWLMLYLQCWEELCSISCPLKQMYSLHSSTRNEYGGCMDTKQRHSWNRKHINSSTIKNYIRHLWMILCRMHWLIIFSVLELYYDKFISYSLYHILTHDSSLRASTSWQVDRNDSRKKN